MIILSVGGASLEDTQQQTFIKSARKSMPRTPLVVISDREESKEVCAAFEAGAAGFMPTSIDPSVALQALSFIKSGDHFFPRPLCIGKSHHSRRKLPLNGRIKLISGR